MTEAAVTAFDVVFGIFVVATVVLIVLVLRFTLQRAAFAREGWLAGDGAHGTGVGRRGRRTRRGRAAGGDGSPADDADGADEADQRDDEDGSFGEDTRPLTALVCAGGGTRGAVQIGMLQVLAEHGFRPDRIYGTSVGAINGAGFAGDPTPEGVERMARIWTGLSRDDVYPQGRLHGPWLYFQQRDAVYSNSGLRRIIEEGVAFERLEEATIPFEVVATSLVDGRERWFTYGPAVEAILASAALPAIFPPVEIDGERYIDGGVVNNVPLRRAIDAGAKRIVVLMCSPPTFEPGRARRPIESVLNALFISVHARFARDMSQLPPDVEVVLFTAGAPGEGGRSFGDFSSTAELVAEGRREAGEVMRRYGPDLAAPAWGPATERHRPAAGPRVAPSVPASPSAPVAPSMPVALWAPVESATSAARAPSTASVNSTRSGWAAAASNAASADVPSVPARPPLFTVGRRAVAASRRRLRERRSDALSRPAARPSAASPNAGSGTGTPAGWRGATTGTEDAPTASEPASPSVTVTDSGSDPAPSIHPTPGS